MKDLLRDAKVRAGRDDDAKILDTIGIVSKGPNGPPLYYELLSLLRWRGEERRLDRALQRLRKRGLVRYLKKADGGPGWATIHKVEKKT